MTTLQQHTTAPAHQAASPATSVMTIGRTAIAVTNASVRLADGSVLLDGVDFDAHAGELIAIIGASGAGKSTLLDLIGGNITPTSGEVSIGGSSTGSLTSQERRNIAFVPQDDVVPTDLPLGRMLRYAARLRLPKGTSTAAVDAAVDVALGQVDLLGAANVVVKQLSGGQRRRASIAVELLTSPQVCLLDEPTSGLDPATATLIVDELRTLADAGRAVVFVTHNAADLDRCDRIVALGSGGRVTFDGPPGRAALVAGSPDADHIHRSLISGEARDQARAAALIEPTNDAAAAGEATSARLALPVTVTPPRRAQPSSRTQWLALTARTLETVVRNKLTLAVMVGSPAMVIAMFAVLFQPGAFDPASPSPSSAVMIAFWVAFGGFFFGLTYGLLQICPEVGVIRREHRSGVGVGLQVASKLAALTPVLLLIDIAMLAVLRGLDRLPATDLETTAALAVTLALDALAALALGLLTSALVRNPSQASLALPMLCFPAVLFSGAVLPVPVMAPVGRAISAAMPDRWAFELIGKDLGLRELFEADPSPFGPALLAEFDDTWTVSTTSVWLLLGSITVGLSLAATAALSARCRRDGRHSPTSS